MVTSMSTAAAPAKTNGPAFDVEEICRIIRTVELGGGKFLGFQPGLKEYLVLFCHPASHGTLGLRMCEFTLEAVRRKISSASAAHAAFALK
jgi:hypothetical protein